MSSANGETRGTGVEFYVCERAFVYHFFVLLLDLNVYLLFFQLQLYYEYGQNSYS